MADLKTALASAAATVERAIDAALKPDGTAVPEAMGYAVGGGKALRGFLVLETARLHGVKRDVATPIAAAIEAVHAYSLIHDDLPSMDNDDLRRGQPTVHRAWNEATAILAGDALQALAFELIATAQLPDKAKVVLIQTLAADAGAQGMVGGQAMDISAETADRPLTLSQIEALQAKKTGALIEWACAAGPRMLDGDVTPLQTYGRALGLAFQIADDILDVEGDAATVGKAVGKDAGAGKATFVSLLGMDAAKSRAKALIQEACDALDIYGEDADVLRDAARFVITRDK
jgi:farnesyl diphosphate synthase